MLKMHAKISILGESTKAQSENLNHISLISLSHFYSVISCGANSSTPCQLYASSLWREDFARKATATLAVKRITDVEVCINHQVFCVYISTESAKYFNRSRDSLFAHTIFSSSAPSHHVLFLSASIHDTKI